MELFLRHRLRDLERFVRRMRARPEFLPVSLGTIAGIAVAYFLTSLVAVHNGGPRTLIFLLYSFGLPSSILLAMRNHHMARALAVALGWCAVVMLATRVVFDFINLPTGPGSTVRSVGTAYMGLLTFVMSLIRDMRRQGGRPGAQALPGETP